VRERETFFARILSEEDAETIDEDTERRDNRGAKYAFSRVVRGFLFHFSVRASRTHHRSITGFPTHHRSITGFDFRDVDAASRAFWFSRGRKRATSH
jgi:hypothetical protein